MTGIEYEGSVKKSVKIQVRPKSEFRAILTIFEAFKYPDSGIPDEQITFAILELVSNAMRAQCERGRDEAIVIRLRIEKGQMVVTVRDRGGGFDPASLPYPMSTPPESINLMAPDFIAYREKYNNTRFGMGLIAVRKIFTLFEMKFVDGSDAECTWPSPEIEGTLITLGLSLRE